MSFLKRLIPLKAKVWVQLDKPAFQEGENVTGKVVIEASEYVKGDEIRVEARVYEHYAEMVQVKRDDQWVWERQQRQDTRFSNDTRIYGPKDFGNGTQYFPFNINVPVYRSSHNDGSIQYSLKGVVAVKGRMDVTGEIDLGFLPPGQVPVQSVNVARQKVECEYCHSQIDASLDKCPNCGARRTIAVLSQ